MRLLALRTVLAAVDHTDDRDDVLTTARRLASAAGAALHVCRVSPYSGASAERAAGEAPTDASLASLLRDVPEATPHSLVGDAATTICALAVQISADVIVLGPRRAQPASDGAKLLGATALAVVTNALVPCLVARGILPLPLGKVLVPIDASDTARGALIVALSWASALRSSGLEKNGSPGTTLIALHVGADGRVLDDALAIARREAGSWSGVELVGSLVDAANVAEAIADHAATVGADLVVLGTRGLGLESAERMGSVSTKATRLLDSPVLLVPPAVWASQ